MSDKVIALLKTAILVEQDIVNARQKTRRAAQFLGFDAQDQARLGTAVSELSRNVFQYAGGGMVTYAFKPPQSFIIEVSDSGPGIANLTMVLNGDYKSATGMGVGLLGAKRLMDDFAIESSPGKGTKITLVKKLSRPAAISMASVGNLVKELAAKPAESAMEEMQLQNRELLQALAESRGAKTELAELNRELVETNRGVVALYSELDEKAVSLQRANVIKTSFLSNMTHEFRTPLSSIISLTRILQSRIDGELTSEQEKQIGYIRQSSESLLELVNDLLDLAKVEAGKVSVKTTEFSVEEVFSALRGVFRPLLSSPNVVLIVENLPQNLTMVNDMAKLSQILRNLLSNAIKFTESGTIRLIANELNDDRLEFAVSDSGNGIAAQHLETIFGDFIQIAGENHLGPKGSGLGLPLSRKLAGLLGGTLSVESELGSGSVFKLILPRVYRGNDEAVLISEEGQRDHRANATQASEKFRVLIVDDHEPSRYVLRNMIGHEIKADFLEVADGELGIAKIKEWQPDVVFLDLNMPRLDGFQVLQMVRQDARLKSLPIIVNTARKLSREESSALEQLATAVLSKDIVDDSHARDQLKFALNRAGFDYKRETHGPS